MATEATIEDLIEYLKSKPSPFDMARRMPLMVAGLQNLVERLQVVEQDRLLDIDRVAKLESLTEEDKTALASVVRDRDALQKEVAALSQRVDAMEKARAAPPAVGPSTTSPFPIGAMSPAPSQPLAVGGVG